MKHQIRTETPALYHGDAEASEDVIIERAKAILMKRMKKSRLSFENLTSIHLAKQFVTLQLAERKNEVFCVIYMDTQNRPIAFEEAIHGTIDHATVPPRLIVEKCLQHGAGSVFFVHNHPGGSPHASEADKKITYKLKEVLAHIDVKVLDHFIVGGGDEVSSFVEQGLL